ncbi:MAG: hypothetical protein KA436_12550 [Oligoflexales bacterium]|nr:hypothetical protein [Oligoflexales bacterium]
MMFLTQHLSPKEAKKHLKHEVGHALADPDIARGHFSFTIIDGEFAHATYYLGRVSLDNYPCSIALAIIRGAGKDMSGTDAIMGLQVYRKMDRCKLNGSCPLEPECHSLKLD